MASLSSDYTNTHQDSVHRYNMATHTVISAIWKMLVQYHFDFTIHSFYFFNINNSVIFIDSSQICYVCFIINLCISMILISVISNNLFANRLFDLTLTVHQSLGVQLNVKLSNVEEENTTINTNGNDDFMDDLFITF